MSKVDKDQVAPDPDEVRQAGTTLGVATRGTPNTPYWQARAVAQKLGIPAGRVSMIPLQTSTVRTPYRYMDSPGNYASRQHLSDNLMESGRISPLVDPQGFAEANARQKYGRTPDAVERDALQATRDANAAAYEELGSPLSLADKSERMAQRMTSRLVPGEKDKYSADSITAQNAIEQAMFDKPEASDASFGVPTGRAWVGDHLKALADKKIAQFNDAPMPPSAEVVGQQSSTYGRLRWLATTHAGLYDSVSQAVSQGTMDAYDVAKVTNLTLARQAAFEIANTPDQMRRDQLLAAQGTDAQRALVIAILLNGANSAGPEPDPASANLFVKVTKPIADWALKTGLPVLSEASNVIVRTAMTAANVGDNKVTGWDTQDNLMAAQWNPAMWRDAWNQTRPGYMRPEDVTYLQDKYGASNVNLLLEAMELRNLGEGDVVGELYERYLDNPEALNIIDSLFFTREVTPEMGEMVREVSYLDSGNYGAWQVRGLANLFGGEQAAQEAWDQFGYGWARDALNVASWIALDPFLVGGKVFKVAKAARVGLHKLAPGKIDNVFQQKSVRIYWDDLGKRLEDARGKSSGLERRAALRRIARQEKAWFTPDVVQSLYKAEVKNADDALEWFREMDNVQRVMAGQPARRAGQKYVPHAAGFGLTVGRKRISTTIRALDPTMRVSERWGKEFDEVAAQADSMTESPVLNGRRWEELSDEEAAAALVQISNNPQAAELMGRWMGDFTGDRSLAGKFWDAVRVGKAEKARQYGWARRKTADRYMQDLSRVFATVPDMRAGINIADGRDAQKVYQQARVAGFPRWFATELSQLFIAAQPGQRRMMLAGLARTQAYVVGANLVDPDEGVDSMLKLVTGYRPGEAYAAAMIPGSERKLRQIVAEVRAEAEQTLRLNTEAEDADDLARLNDMYGQQVVNEAVDFEALRLTREETASAVNKLEGELADLDRQLEELALGGDEALGPEYVAAVNDALDNLVMGIDDDARGLINQGQTGAYATTGRTALDEFYIPAPREYATNGMRWSKTAGGGRRARVRDAESGQMVTYMVEAADGGYRLTVTRPAAQAGDMAQTEVVELGTFPGVRAAQKQAQLDAGKRMEKRQRASGVELDMLERGYLPVKWAEDLRDGVADVDTERQWRLLTDPFSDQSVATSLPEWDEVIRQAEKVDGVKGRWIPIPWVQDLRNTVRRDFEGQFEQGYESVLRELENAKAQLNDADMTLAELRAQGIMDMDGLKASLPARTGMTEDEILAISRERWQTWVRNQQPTSPSDSGAAQMAVFMPQTAETVAFPALNQLEPLLARNTYLGVLLGRNVGASTLTDMWVFATLAGPRFPVRNAFEDWMFWGLTAGAFVGEGSLRKGRRAAQGLRQARQIQDKKYRALVDERDRVIEELEAARGTRAPNEIRDLENTLSNLEKKVKKANRDGRNGVRTEKLGFIKTLMRRGGTAVMRFDNSVDPVESRLRAIVHPYLSDEEISRANAAYADGSREELAELIATAAVRERVLFIPPGKGVSDKLKNWVRARNGDRSVLSEADQKQLEEIEQFARGRNGFENLEAASEESRNMMDGNLPSWQDSPDFVYAGDTPLQRMFINGQYTTRESAGIPTKKSVDSTWQTLVMALHGDGPKSQAAMYHLPDWMSASAARREELVDEVAAAIIRADEETGYIGRFSLVNATGDIDEVEVRELARRTLLTLEGAFTTTSGEFNEALWKQLRVVTEGSEGGKLVKFKLWEDLPTGARTLDGQDQIQRQYRVNKSDFINGTYDMPRTYLTYEGIPVVAPAESRQGWGWWQKFSNPMWDAMGRSLARMTREPMFMANYLDARAALRPFESEWKRLYGDEWWTVADDIATEQAYNITLAYVDNPAVRSQLAWQVRNVARFWRASEDFFRRSYKAVKYNPMSVYKAAWAVNHLRDAGWVEWDENGDPYFIYPGTQPMFDAMNVGMQFLGRADFGLGSSSLPLAMTGRVVGLTPSADPEATLPTLSGWFSQVPVRAMLEFAPSLDRYLSPVLGEGRIADVANVAEATLFGDITAQSQANVFADAVPTHLKRLQSLWDSLRVSNEDSLKLAEGAVADSIRTAITANVRAGRIAPDQEITNDQREEIMRQVDATATDIMTLKLLGGLLLPASPNFKFDDVSEIGREFGMYSLKQEYYDMRQRFGSEVANLLWFERHPDEAPYTVSSAGLSPFEGFWSASAETEDWIRDNRTLVEDYPLGASIVAPPQDASVFNPNSYNFLQRQGLINKATVGNFLLKQSNSLSYLEYQSMMAEYKAGVELAYQTISDPTALKNTLSELDDRLSNKRKALYAKNPALEQRIMANEWEMSPEAVSKEMYTAVVTALPNAQGDQVKRLTDMKTVLDQYQQAKSMLDAVPQQDRLTDGYEDLTQELRDRWSNFVMEWYGQYRDDNGFVSMLRTTSDSLGFQIRELR